MPLRVKKGGKTAEPITGELIEPGYEEEGGVNVRTVTGLVVNTAQFRDYGKMRLNAREIAAMLGTSHQAALNMMRRSDLRAAYEKGASQCAVALRTKALNMALAGNEKMLTLCLATFGNISAIEDDNRIRDITPTEPGTARRSWASELARLADDTAKKYAEEG